MRGLKLVLINRVFMIFKVAPLVGAWIETLLMRIDSLKCDVAPLVGAWIETAKANDLRAAGLKSHPSWVRGLKHVKRNVEIAE